MCLCYKDGDMFIRISELLNIQINFCYNKKEKVAGYTVLIFSASIDGERCDEQVARYFK